ncbi:MAG: tRNA-specific 2-thiouridylase [Candidatus Sabulitectum sp.]|nr:tRNA-specific 2-thiouridylase [Candidatus Sabulitectum sp.]
MPEARYTALVCLSGGVDSTAALLRCRTMFEDVRAVYVDTTGRGAPDEAGRSCEILGVELIEAEAIDLFNREIKEYTRRIYSMGQTPNPCAMCNAKVKLAVPFSMLKENEFLVTGHYAGNYDGSLKRGRDPSRDQSYFLSLVAEEILDRCWFPLAESMKTDVRREVLEKGLPFITGDSQDLCFVRVNSGIPGDIVDASGNVVGRHTGLEGYTPGQRKGLGAHGERKFVTELDTRNNRLVIGDEKYLYSESCFLNSINWLRKPAEQRFTCMIQTRYRKPVVQADVTLQADGRGASVEFCGPQKAVAPGQVGALYSADTVIGGGIITGYKGGEHA